MLLASRCFEAGDLGKNVVRGPVKGSCFSFSTSRDPKVGKSCSEHIEEVFVEAVSKLATFKKSTRTGLVDHLEKAIVDAGLLIAEKLLIADSVSCSMSYVDAVIEVMSLIPDRPTSMQFINKLNKVKVKASSTLAMNELGRVLSSVDAIESESHGEWKEKVVPFLTSFLQPIKICKGSQFPNETMTNLLHGFVATAFKCIFSLYRAPRILRASVLMIWMCLLMCVTP